MSYSKKTYFKKNVLLGVNNSHLSIRLSLIYLYENRKNLLM